MFLNSLYNQWPPLRSDSTSGLDQNFHLAAKASMKSLCFDKTWLESDLSEND